MEKLLNIYYSVLEKTEMSKNDITELQKIVEILYFNYIKKWYRSKKTSEEYKIAKDIQKFDYILSQTPISFNSFSPKSKLIKKELSLYEDLLSKSHLDQHEINLIQTQLIEKYNYYIKAIFIVDIIHSEYKKEQKRWIIGILLGFIFGFFIKNFKLILDFLLFS